MYINRATAIFCLCFITTFPWNQASAETAIIVNPNNPASDLSMDTIKRIFLGKQKRYPNGDIAIPIDRKSSDPIRQGFVEHVLGKSSNQLLSYWSQKIFTGKGQPPKQMDNDEEIKNLVSQNPSIISFVDKSAVDASVKVILEY